MGRFTAALDFGVIVKKKKNPVVPNCHPTSKHFANGLCKNCYSTEWKRVHYGSHPKGYRAIRNYIVYAYFSKDGVCLYVGRGTIDRAKSHKYPYKNSSWWSSDLLLITMTCKNEWEAMEYEGKWGGYYLPKYNKEGNRPYRDRHEKRLKEGEMEID